MLNSEYSRKYCCSGCIFSLLFEFIWKILSKILHLRKLYVYVKEVTNFHKNSGGRVRGAEDKVFVFATCWLFSSPIPHPTPLEFPTGWLLALWGCGEENKRKWC
jgi:hypothetical protein